MTLEITSGQVYRGKLLEGQLMPPFSFLLSSLFQKSLDNTAHEPGTDPLTRSSLSCSRRQHERPTERHHRHRSRRPREPSRSSLHPREPREVFYCARHATVRGYKHALTVCQRAELTRYLIGTRLCSGREGQEAGVWGWQEEGLL